MKYLSRMSGQAGIVVALLFAAGLARGEITLPDSSSEPENRKPDISTVTNPGESDNAATNMPLRLSLELKDSSRVVGVPSAQNLPFKTSFADINLEWKLVESMRFSADRKSVSVSFLNGDKLEGSTSVASLKLETIFGKVTVHYRRGSYCRQHGQRWPAERPCSFLLV